MVVNARLERYRYAISSLNAWTTSDDAQHGHPGRLAGNSLQSEFSDRIKTFLPYLALGFIVWGFLSTTINESCNAFTESERIIKQVKVPFSVFVCVLCGEISSSRCIR